MSGSHLGTVSFRSARRRTDGFIVLFLSQGFTHSLGLTKRIMNVRVGRPVQEKYDPLTGRTLPRIAVSQPPGLVSKFRFTSRTAHQNGVINAHWMSQIGRA